jgi:hypothetical protein
MQPPLGRFEPRLEPVTIPALRLDQYGPRGLNEQNAQVAIAAFRYLAEDGADGTPRLEERKLYNAYCLLDRGIIAAVRLPSRTNVCTRRKRTCGPQGGSPGSIPIQTLGLG